LDESDRYITVPLKVIHGKKALVTGAASGIGRSISLALAREGADLFLLDRDEEKLAWVGEEVRYLGVEVISRHCDVAEGEQIVQAVDTLQDVWGEIDILVNNAGILYYGRTEQMSEEQWESLLSVNLFAPIRFVRLLLPLLRERPEAHILNVCSLAGLVPKRRLAAYQSSKFGLVGLSQSLRLEYSPKGVGVTALCPGLVDTDLMDAAFERNWITSKPSIPRFLSVSPDRIAARAVKAIQKNQGLVVIPAYARLVWLFVRLFPRFLDSLQHFKHRKRKR
jgi:short-subunit dehydrogenase